MESILSQFFCSAGYNTGLYWLLSVANFVIVG